MSSSRSYIRPLKAPFAVSLRGVATRFMIVAAMLVPSLALKAQVNAEQVMSIGRNVLSMEDYLLAIQYFNQAIKGKPYLAEPYYLRGLAKLQLDDYEGAVADESLALKRNKFKSEAYKVRGFALQNLGRDSLAILDYDKGLEYDPTDRYFLFYKAVAQTSLKRYEAADSTFATLLRCNPGFEDAWCARARLNLLRGDTVAALADADKTLQLSKSVANAYLIKAQIMAARSQWPEALESLDEVIRLNPAEPDFYINRAYLRYNDSNFFGAMADYNYALELDPGNPFALFNRALLRFEVKELDNAEADFTRVLEMDPKNFHALYNRGLVRLELDKNRQAREDFLKIAAQYPRFYPVYHALAETSRRLGDLQAVGKYIRQADALVSGYVHDPGKNPLDRPTIEAGKSHVGGDLAEEPDETEVMERFNQLVTASVTEEPRMAFNDRIKGRVQDRAVSVAPEPAFVLSFTPPETSLRNTSHYLRQIDDINQYNYLPDKIYLRAGLPLADEHEISRLFSREEAYTSRLAAGKGRPVDRFARGVARTMLKNYDEAIKDFTAAADSADGFTAAIFGRAYAREASGDHRGAIADLDEILRSEPRMVYAWFNKGVIYYNLGDYTAAMQAFAEALAVDPTLGAAYYNRGLCYMHVGNRQAAFADLSKAGELGVLPSYNLIKRMK